MFGISRVGRVTNLVYLNKNRNHEWKGADNETD